VTQQLEFNPQLQPPAGDSGRAGELVDLECPDPPPDRTALRASQQRQDAHQASPRASELRGIFAGATASRSEPGCYGSGAIRTSKPVSIAK
jgi:hypothetical protein